MQSLKLALNILVPCLVAVSASLIFIQFTLGLPLFIHHAYICAAIFALAAYYAQRFGRTRLVRASVCFALFGMGLGMLELIAAVFSVPALALTSCLDAVPQI